ncbi:MAG: iron-containing alcohol dehydrogenase [Rickettsiales bacterium]
MEKAEEAVSLSERLVGAGVVSRLGESLQTHLPGANYLLVCDDATWLAAGERVRQMLFTHVGITPFSFGRAPLASTENAGKLVAQAAAMDGLIAVGSGTINDLTKYAATVAGKPYISIATAASMNGYNSATASLEHHGFKHSYPARPPRLVIADLDVIIAAPRRLSRAGLGDTLCRTSVESDTLLAHYLFDAPYLREAFEQFRQYETTLVTQSTGFKQNDPAYFELLMHALLDTGEWMAKSGSSAIASQGEHMIVHTAELMYGAELCNYTHGELVALATITHSNLQEKMLLGKPVVRAMPREEHHFIRQFGRAAGPDLFALYHKKANMVDDVDGLQRKLDGLWQEIKAAILAIQQPSGVLERLYRQLNLPTATSDLRLNADRYQSAVTYAYLTRDRFTFLDLAAMSVKR